MYRFLLTRRWVGLAVVALVLAAVSGRLGVWQFQRLDERAAENAVVERNLGAAAVPVERVASVGAPADPTGEWRTVSMSGTYDADGQLLLRYQTRGPLRGVDLVVPLELADGTYVLVDRGFLESPAGTPDAADVPAPPTGRVEVTGWLRTDSTASDEGVVPQGGTIRAVSSAALGQGVDGPLRGGWVQARTESPPGRVELLGPEEPETSSGPHLFYGLQWFLFGFLGLLGYGWFAYDEAHPHRRRRRPARPGPEDDPERPGDGPRSQVSQGPLRN